MNKYFFFVFKEKKKRKTQVPLDYDRNRGDTYILIKLRSYYLFELILL